MTASHTDTRKQMKVVGFCGFSGSGKTTLVEQLITRLRLAGERVSVIKHAHHAFDIDHEGKDSWRHRQAGAYEVVVASDQRLAKIREYDTAREPVLDELIAELAPCDWALVEGFKTAPLPKLEVWRHATGKSVRYPEDPFVLAIVTDSPGQLPVATALPVLDLNGPDAVVGFLMRESARFERGGSRIGAAQGAALRSN